MEKCKLCPKEIKEEDLCEKFNDGYICERCAKKLAYLMNKVPY